MARRLIHLAVLGFVLAFVPSGAQAQEHLFRTWFVAPESVEAGETFQVWMWATYEIDGFTVPSLESPSKHLYSVYGSIEVTGDLATFDHISTVLDGLSYHLFPGTPAGSWLRDFAVLQTLGLPGGFVEYANPLAVVMFEIGTTASSRGELEIHFRPPSDLDVPYLDWWDSPSNDWISTIDPGVGLTTESITVRVIPAPAGVAILALGGVASLRRRRSLQSGNLRAIFM